MKKFFLAAFLFFILCIGLSAQDMKTSLSPRDARSMGMSGAFRVFSTGYATFFGNPAGFAGPSSLTIADLAGWAYLKPYPANVSALVGIAQGQADQIGFESTIGSLMAEDNGFGGGFALGLGWAGGGFGLGLNLISDAQAKDSSYSGSKVNVQSQANAIFGMAWPMDLGKFSLRFGADVRAFYLLDSRGDWPFDELATALYTGTGFVEDLSVLSARGGFGLAVDSGATLSWGPLSVGVMIRDYGYKFYMGDTTVGDIIQEGSPPMSGEILCALTPQYSAGLSLVLGKGSSVVTSLYAEVNDPMSFVTQAGSDFSTALDLLHAGFEFRILKFLSLRGGANHGLMALGFGMDFSLIEVDAALFTESLDSSSTRTGVTVQAALRI
ncbi:MAG: hypothetical protein NT061_02830 [Spirochaetes bacterium]|nr:hypothetical protein [Spirochaetota bacterium]